MRVTLFGSRIDWQYFVLVCTQSSVLLMRLIVLSEKSQQLFVHLPKKVRGSQQLKTALQPKAEFRNYLLKYLFKLQVNPK